MSSFIENISNFMTIENSRVLLTFEVSKKCNVFCPNCYIPEESRLRDKNLFDLNLIDKIAESELLKKAKEFRVSVYGGELSIVDKDYTIQFLDKIEKNFPGSFLTIVSNLYNLKPSFIDIYDKYSTMLETTFDLGRHSMKKNRDAFLIEFQKGFETIAARKNDFHMDIGFRMNKQSLEYGIDNMIKYFRGFNLPKGAKVNLLMEHAIDFAHFRSNGNPSYKSGYPILKPELSYQQFTDYMLELKYKKHLLEENGFYPLQLTKNAMAPEDRLFNSGGGGYMISFASTGHTTINPLFTDVPSAFIGNIYNEPLDKMLTSEKFINLKKHERSRLYGCSNCDIYDQCLGGPIFITKEDPYGSKECAGLMGLLKSI